MGFDWSAAAVTFGWAAGVVGLVLAATFAGARIVGRHSVIDIAWGLLFVAVAVVAFARSAGSGQDVRRWLLLVLAALWGLRLAWHIFRRSIGRGEDPRYAALLAKAPRHPQLYAVTVIYLLQGVLALVIATPLVVGAFENGSVGPLAWIGVAIWIVGLFFEAVGDAQLEQFRRHREHRGPVLDTGLWRYTRHPNYFGDACVWWGIFLIAADALPGVATVYAPVLMTLLLTRGSGARILEQHMRGRPGWADYAARTSMFVPRPPKRTAQP